MVGVTALQADNNIATSSSEADLKVTLGFILFVQLNNKASIFNRNMLHTLCEAAPESILLSILLN
jgi:hypothetical protein